MDASAWLVLATLPTAAVVGLRRWPGLRWIVASVPCWVFGNAAEWILLVAVGMTVVGMFVGAVGPALVGRRVRDASRVPLPHLASGPLVPVASRLYVGGQRSRVLHYLAIGMAVLAVVLLVAAASSDEQDELGALGLSSVIIASTFAFGNWFADRVRLRTDGEGVHGRTLFFERTARWTEISGLRLRYMFLMGFSVRLVYYVVETPSVEVAFPSSMRGAKELQQAIEEATGLRWAEPEIVANM